MTEKIQPVKIPAQDDPVTVDQVRSLTQNNHYIRSMWRNMIFSAAWPDGETAGNALDEVFSAPDVVYPRGITSIRVALYVNNTGGSYSGTFTFDIIDSVSAGVDYSSVETVAAGGSWIVISIPLQYGNLFLNDFITSGLGFSCAGTGTSTTYVNYVGFWGEMDEESTTDPQLYEVASNLHLRVPAAELNALNTVPQFLGGWMYSGDGDKLSRDAGASTPESFRMFHLLDYADDQLSEDKAYSMGVAKAGTTTAPANTFVSKMYHLESSDSNSKEMSVYTQDLTRLTISDVAGESWAESSRQSVITADFYTSGGSADDSYLKGIAFTGNDPTPYSTARNQGANRTACDSAYFEALPDATVDPDTINGIGRAQFNSMFRRAGQAQAILFREGKDFSLTSTLVDFWRFAHYVRDSEIWFTNYRTKQEMRGQVCVAAYIPSGTVTMQIELSSGALSDSDTLQFDLVAGMNYLSDEWVLELEDDIGYLDTIETKIRDKAGASTVKIYGVWIGTESHTSTY